MIAQAIRWLALTAGPWLLQGFIAKLLIQLGIAVVSAAVVLVAFNTLLSIAVAQVASLSAANAAAFNLMALFGVFKALSLIASTALAKATWLAAKPHMSWFQQGQ